jgi:hypothetical protein
MMASPSSRSCASGGGGDVEERRRPRGNAHGRACGVRAPERGDASVWGSVNASLTTPNSKISNGAQTNLNTKVVDWATLYNNCKGRHMVWWKVWLGTRREKFSFCTTQNTIHMAFTEFLSFESSYFEMLPIRKVVSLEKMYNFCIGRFWSVSAEFGERAKSSRAG